MRETRVKLRCKEHDGQRFYFVDLGNEIHDRPSARLWVSGKLVKEGKEGPEVELTGKRALIRTDKGNWVLKPSQKTFTFLVGWDCGYRGHSTFEIKERTLRILYFREYKSPRGSLGISEFALVCSEKPELKVQLKRTGRLYGAPSKALAVYTAKEEGQEVKLLEDYEEDPDLIKELAD